MGGILLSFRYRRSPLRLRTNNKTSAQPSNEIDSGSNDRFGIIQGEVTKNRGKHRILSGFSVELLVFSNIFL